MALLLDGDRLIGIGAGIGLALIAVGESVWRLRRQINRRHGALVGRWRSLPRASRRQLRQAIRKGTPVPREHAADVIESIDLVLALRRAENIGRRRALYRNTAFLVFNLAVAALFLSSSNRTRFELISGYALASLGIAFVLLAGAALVRNELWDRRWPARLAVARSEAEEALHAPAQASAHRQ